MQRNKQGQKVLHEEFLRANFFVLVEQKTLFAEVWHNQKERFTHARKEINFQV